MLDDDYPVAIVAIQTFPIDWTIVKTVTVYLGYRSATGQQIEESLTFTEETRARQWRLPNDYPTAPSFSYHCCYELRDGSERHTKPLTTQSREIALPHPFVLLPIALRFQSDGVPFRALLIDIAYEDAANIYMAHERVRVDAIQSAPRQVQLPIVDHRHRCFRYRISLIDREGQLVRGAFIATTEPTIAVDLTPFAPAAGGIA